jgi:hypothetical protein
MGAIQPRDGIIDVDRDQAELGTPMTIATR